MLTIPSNPSARAVASISKITVDAHTAVLTRTFLAAEVVQVAVLSCPSFTALAFIPTLIDQIDTSAFVEARIRVAEILLF